MKPPADERLLRRYVIARAAGRRMPEWTYFIPEIVPGLSAWKYADARTVKEAEHWRRIRRPGAPWCPWLGNHLSIASDDALQVHFLTISEDGWARMETVVRASPARCLAEWRAAGARLIEVVRASASGAPTSGKLTGWPAARGDGPRTPIGAY